MRRRSNDPMMNGQAVRVRIAGGQEGDICFVVRPQPGSALEAEPSRLAKWVNYTAKGYGGRLVDVVEVVK